MGSREQVYIQQDSDGSMWVCDEYDHGVFCRGCTQVTSPVIRKALIELSDLRAASA